MKFKLIIDQNAEEEMILKVKQPSSFTKQIESFIQTYKSQYVIGTYEDEICKLLFTEIECITIIDRKVIVVHQNRKHYRIQERLRDLELILPDYFLRINKSTIANMHSIVRFQSLITGSVNVIFQSGYQDYVSRRCLSEIKRTFKNL